MYGRKIAFSLSGDVLNYEFRGKRYELKLHEKWPGCNFRIGEILMICVESEGGYYTHEDELPVPKLKEMELFKPGKNKKMVCLLSKESRIQLEELLKQAGYELLS